MSRLTSRRTMCLREVFFLNEYWASHPEQRYSGWLHRPVGLRKAGIWQSQPSIRHKGGCLGLPGGSVLILVEARKPCSRPVASSNRPELKHPGYGAKPGKPGFRAPVADESPARGAMLCSAAASSQSTPCPRQYPTTEIDCPCRPRLDLGAYHDIMDRGQHRCATFFAAS